MPEDDETIEEKEEPTELKSEVKQPDEPKKTEIASKKKSSIGDIFMGMTRIHKEGSGTAEDRNEPHTHLMLLLILVIILGVAIGFIGI